MIKFLIYLARGISGHSAHSFSYFLQLDLYE
jgi:hypothetical protein